jgi:putative aminopeptidase FrvX
MKAPHRRLLVDLLALPTAPFNEHQVIDHIRRWAADRPAITVTTDEYGNLKLYLRRGNARSARPLLLTAHLDHPGFEAGRMIGPRRLQATWLGGVQPEYFRNARVRFHSEGGWIRGRIRAVQLTEDAGRLRVATAEIEVPRPVPAGAPGMWDLPDPVIRGSRVFARGCDDVAGAAAILAALGELHEAGTPVEIGAIFTRAEEVGFAGAIACCRSGLLPKQARVISVECSSVIPGVQMGAGPILRVGDRASVFTPELTAWCKHVADDLNKRDRDFGYQRKLMDGGTCESTAFCRYGFEATGLCLALGNYHNMNARRHRIAAEFVDLNDFDKLVRWFVALATARRNGKPATAALGRFLDGLGRKWSPVLKRTAR